MREIHAAGTILNLTKTNYDGMNLIGLTQIRVAITFIFQNYGECLGSVRKTNFVSSTIPCTVYNYLSLTNKTSHTR
jgi:hypothetical protein